MFSFWLSDVNGTWKWVFALEEDLRYISSQNIEPIRHDKGYCETNGGFRTSELRSQGEVCLGQYDLK